MKFRKKIFLWGVLGAIIYTLMTRHFIFIDRSFKVLKKSQPTLEYTFFSAEGKTNRSILSIEALRKDGIADVLVRANRMTEDEKEILLYKIEEETR